MPDFFRSYSGSNNRDGTELIFACRRYLLPEAENGR
jgi:hypothetical protein